MASVTILPPDEGDRTAAVVAAEIITAINTTADTDGDVVFLPPGYFDCTASVLQPLAAITIRGAGIGDGSGGTTRIKARMKSVYGLTMRDFSWTTEGLAAAQSEAPIELFDADYSLTNMQIGIGTTNNTNSVLCFLAVSSAMQATLRDCEISHGAKDTISTKASNSTLGEASMLSLHNCNVHHCGDGSSDQVLTAHTGFGVRMHGGSLTNAGAEQILCASDGVAATKISLYGVVMDEGFVTAEDLIGCTIQTGLLRANRVASRNVILATKSKTKWYAGLTLYGGALAVGNLVVNTPGVAIGGILQNSMGGSRILNNIVVGFSSNSQSGISTENNSGGLHEIVNNTVIGCRRGVRMRIGASAGSTSTFIYSNNAISGATEYHTMMDAGMPAPAGGFNCLNGGTVSNYTVKATDIEALPQLDDRYVPYSGGNCDIGRGAVIRALGELDSRGVPKLGLEDCIGAVYPSGGRHGDLLKPVVVYEVVR